MDDSGVFLSHPFFFPLRYEVAIRSARKMQTTKDKIRNLINGEVRVWLFADFADLASASCISSALRDLVSSNELIRFSRGAYVNTKVSVITGNYIPALPMEVIVHKLFERLGIKIYPVAATIAYNSGKTTQVPGRFIISTGKRKITRKVGANRPWFEYEPSSMFTQNGIAGK